MSEAVKKIFDEISPTYDRLNHLLSFNVDKSWRKKTIASIQRKPNESFQVLDLCAGTHDLGLECHRQFPNAKIVGADFSSEMLRMGDEKLAKLGKTEVIQSLCADALNLPLENATFDVILCAYGVRNFDDAKTGLKEMFRVLKPGGQILVLEFFRPTKPLAKFFNKTYGQFVLPSVGKLVSGHTSAYTYLKQSITGFLSTKEFETLMQDVGLQNVKTKNFLMAISSLVTGFKA